VSTAISLYLLNGESSRTVSYDINDLEQVFHEELESKGYEIVGSEDNLFEGRDYSAAEHYDSSEN
jgi:hypothetical protein